MIHHWYLASSDECLTIEPVKQNNPNLHVWRVTVRHEEGGSCRFAVTYFRGEWIATKEPSASQTPLSVINGFHGLTRRMNQVLFTSMRPVDYVPDIDQALAEALGHRKPV